MTKTGTVWTVIQKNAGMTIDEIADAVKNEKKIVVQKVINELRRKGYVIARGDEGINRYYTTDKTYVWPDTPRLLVLEAIIAGEKTNEAIARSLKKPISTVATMTCRLRNWGYLSSVTGKTKDGQIRKIYALTGKGKNAAARKCFDPIPRRSPVTGKQDKEAARKKRIEVFTANCRIWDRAVKAARSVA